MPVCFQSQNGRVRRHAPPCRLGRHTENPLHAAVGKPNKYKGRIAVCCAPQNPSRGRLMSSSKRAALYVRVSTDAQTVENQIRELRQVAGRRGWVVVEVYSDAGISGAKGRNGRPGLDSMLKDASRRKF